MTYFDDIFWYFRLIRIAFMSSPTMSSLLCTLENLLAQERNGNLFYKPNDVLTVRVRRILIDWLLEVSILFKLSRESWFYAVSLLDCAASNIELAEKTIQLIGLACLSLSAKKQEIYGPEISDFVYICDGEFDRDQILEMERKVSISINFDFNIPNIIEYIRFYSSSNAIGFEQHSCAIFLCRYYNYHNVKFLPSVVATCVHYMAAKLTNGIFSNIFSISAVVIDQVCSLIAKLVINNINSTSLTGLMKMFNKEFSSVEMTKETFIIALKLFTVFPVNINSDTLKNYKLDNYPKSSSNFMVECNKKSGCLSRRLGEGTYGSVRKITINDVDYAMKKIKIEHADEGVSVTFIREISILKSLNHENVVKIHHTTDNCRTMILELMDMDLKSYVTKHVDIRNSFEFQETCTKYLLTGLSYIHSQGALNRDIKLQNILVRGVWPNLEIKYCDFGCSRGTGLVLNDYRFTHEVTTLWYRAPEILLGAIEYGSGIDVWSLMCTLHEVCTDKALFAGESERDQLHKIFLGLGTPSEKTWPGVTNLVDYQSTFPKWENTMSTKLKEYGYLTKIKTIIMDGLVMDPSKRPSAKKLLSDFLKVIPQNTSITHQNLSKNVQSKNIKKKSKNNKNKKTFVWVEKCKVQSENIQSEINQFFDLLTIY